MGEGFSPSYSLFTGPGNTEGGLKVPEQQAPQQPLPSGTEMAKKQAALAAALRQGSGGGMPQGRLVGAGPGGPQFYVPPTLTQQMMGAAGQGLSLYNSLKPGA